MSACTTVKNWVAEASQKHSLQDIIILQTGKICNLKITATTPAIPIIFKKMPLVNSHLSKAKSKRTAVTETTLCNRCIKANILR